MRFIRLPFELVVLIHARGAHVWAVGPNGLPENGLPETGLWGERRKALGGPGRSFQRLVVPAHARREGGSNAMISRLGTTAAAVATSKSRPTRASRSKISPRVGCQQGQREHHDSHKRGPDEPRV